MALNHIKPHGSLYGMAARDADDRDAVCDAADAFGVPSMGMAGTVHEKVCGATAGSPSSRSTTPTSTTAPTAG